MIEQLVRNDGGRMRTDSNSTRRRGTRTGHWFIAAQQLVLQADLTVQPHKDVLASRLERSAQVSPAARPEVPAHAAPTAA